MNLPDGLGLQPTDTTVGGAQVMVRPSSIPPSAFRVWENSRYFRFLFHNSTVASAADGKGFADKSMLMKPSFLAKKLHWVMTILTLWCSSWHLLSFWHNRFNSCWSQFVGLHLVQGLFPTTVVTMSNFIMNSQPVGMKSKNLRDKHQIGWQTTIGKTNPFESLGVLLNFHRTWNLYRKVKSDN